MDFIFCKLAKRQKTGISFFASLQNLKKHVFHLLQAKKAQKTWILFFACLQNLKKHGFHLLQAKKTQKTHLWDYRDGMMKRLFYKGPLISNAKGTGLRV